MATIKNSELIPKSDLDALDAVYSKIGKASEKTLEWGGVLQGLSKEFSNVNINYKQLTDLINKYEKVVEEANAADAERVKLMNEAAKLEAKIAAANSEEAKRVRELKVEYAAINKEIDANIKNKKAQSDVILEYNTSIRDSNKITEEERVAIERSNEAFAEKAKTLSEVAVWEQENKSATEGSSEAIKAEATAQDAAQSAFDSLTNSIQMQTQGLIEMKLERDQVREQMKSLTKEYEAGNVTHDAYILRTAELTALERDLSTAIDTTADKIKYETQIATTAVGSYENLTAQYSLMKIEINALGEAEGENAEHKRALEAQAKSLYETMDQLQRATGKNQLNVGNYDAAVTDLTKTVSLLDPKLGMIVRKVQNVSAVKKAWIAMNSKLATSLGITTKAATLMQIALAGLAIGGVYLAISAIAKYVKKQQELRKEQLENLNLLNRVNAEGYKNANSEISRLDILYKATQDTSKSMKERINATKQLQQEYPSYLGNMSQEEILAGKAAGAYNDLKTSILASATARAYADKIAENSSKILELEDEITQKLTEREQKQIELAQKQSQPQYGAMTGGAYVEGQKHALEAQIGNMDDFINERKGQIGDLERTNQRLYENIDVSALLSGSSQKPKETSVDTQKQLHDQQKAINDYNLYLILSDANSQKEISANSKKFYQTRLNALDSYLQTQESYIGASAKTQIETINERLQNEEITAEAARYSILLVEKKKEDEIGKIRKDGEEIRLGIAKDYADKQVKEIEKALTDRANAINKAEEAEYAALAEQYSKGEIKVKKFEEKKTEIFQKYAKQRFGADVELLKEQLNIAELTDEQREKIHQEIIEAEIKYERYLTDIVKEEADKQVEIQEKAAQRRREIIQGIADLALSLSQLNTDKYLKSLDEEEDAANDRHDKEVDRIDRLEKAGAISTEQANARKALSEQKLREEEERIEAERAEAEKKQARLNVLLNTTMAIMTATASAPWPFNLIPIGFAVGQGIIQLAAVEAAQYAEGTPEGGHPGGAAWVGDGGRPEMISYGGKYYKTPAVPTLIDLPKGAEVLPDWDAAIMSMAFNSLANEGRYYDKPVVNVDLSPLIALQEQGNAQAAKLARSYNSEKKNQQFYGLLKRTSKYKIN